MNYRHFKDCCDCWHHHHDNGNNNRSNGILYVHNAVRSTVNAGQLLPIPNINQIAIANNNAIRIDSNLIFFTAPGIYDISYSITARIPVAAPTTIPLTIIDEIGGRPDTRLSASVYNNENVATVSGVLMRASDGRVGRGDNVSFRNITRNQLGNLIPIELLFLNITVVKIYDL